MPVEHNFDTLECCIRFLFSNYSHTVQRSRNTVFCMSVDSDGRVGRSFLQVGLTHKFAPGFQYLEKKSPLSYQQRHIQSHHDLVISGRISRTLSVGEKVALFESWSSLPCIGRLVVIYQCPLLFFWRRKLMVVFSGCNQKWYKIRHIITQAVILDAIYFVGFRSRYHYCYEKLTSIYKNPKINFIQVNYSVFLLSVSWARQLLLDIPADPGFLRDKAAILGDRIRVTLCIYCGFKFVP